MRRVLAVLLMGGVACSVGCGKSNEKPAPAKPGNADVKSPPAVAAKSKDDPAATNPVAPTIAAKSSPRRKPVVAVRPRRKAAGSQKSVVKPAKPKPLGKIAQASPLEREAELIRYHRLLSRRPLHRTAFEGLVRHYAQQGRVNELITVYEKRHAAAPNDAAVLLILARLYVRANRGADAAKLLDKLDRSQAKIRGTAELLAFRARVYQQVGQSDAAVRLLRRAIAETKTIAGKTRLVESLADLYLHGRKEKEAAKVLADFAAEYPQEYFHRKRMADALARRKLHTAAIIEYRAVLKLTANNVPRQCEVLRELGRAQEAADKSVDAIASYTQAVNLLSGDHWMKRDLHQRVVRLFRKDGRLKDLVAYCRSQIKKSPTQTAMRELLAEVLLLSGEPDKAKQTLAEAVRLFPKNRALSRKRVDILGRLKDTAGVSAEYQRIISRYPDDVDLYLDYGRTLAASNNVDAARRQWRLVLQNKLSDVTLANRLGALFEQYDLTDDAVQCYRRAIQLDAKRPASYAALSRLWMRKRKKDAAVEVLREMTAANSRDAATHARCASLLLALSMPAEALESIEAACRLEPKEFRHHIIRADLLLRAKKIDDAIAARRLAIDLLPAGRMRQQQVGYFVSLSLSAKKLDRIESNEQTRLKTNAGDTLSLMILSRIAAARGDHARSHAWLLRLLKVDPNHEEGRIRLAKLLVSIGDVNAAEAQYRRLIDLHPARSRLYYEALVNLRSAAADRIGAVKILEELARRFPQNASILHLVARRTMRLGDREKGLAYFTRSLERQSGNHAVRVEFAKALKDMGRLKPALAQYRTAALQNADRAVAVDATQRLYDVASQLGELDALIDEFRTRVERLPQETHVARVLAEFYIREFDYAKAAEFLELILNQNPGDLELRLLRGSLNRRLGRFDAALADYRRALRLPNIDRDYVLGEIGKVHFESGRPADARRTWNQIAVKLYAGNLLRNNGFRADAVAAFQAGLRAQPDSIPLRRQLIHAYETTGQRKQALEARQRLVDTDPDNRTNIEDLAAAYLAQGDRKRAVEVATRLFSLPYTSPSAAGWSSRFSGMSPILLRLYSMYGGGGSNPVAQAVEFFARRGLTAELEPVIENLLQARPKDGLLKQAAIELYTTAFDKPKKALPLLTELETAEFPAEHRAWRGQNPQRQHFRLQRLMTIGTSPALSEIVTKQTAGKKPGELSADERVVLALTRFKQGKRQQGVALLKEAAKVAGDDEVVLSMLVNDLVGLDRHAEAEPYAKRLIKLVAKREADLFPVLREEVQKTFVRQLPVRLQLKIDDKRLDEITRKWRQAGRFSNFAFAQGEGSPLTLMDGYRVRVTLATIYAKTKRLDLAKKTLKSLEPKNPADIDAWAMLAEFALEFDADDVAFHYYEEAMKGARMIARDPLLERIYGNGLNWLMSWAGQEAGNLNSLNRILTAFAKRDRLPEFYDYIRESGSPQRAKKVVEQFKLRDKLIARYTKQLAAERTAFRESKQDALAASIPYFAATCKLAELHDWNGDWDKADALYRAYLKDFPDELGLIQTLAEVAEARGKTDDAAKRLDQLADVQTRLSRRRSAWNERRLSVIPAVPQVLAAKQRDGDPTSWLTRWGSHFAALMWSRTNVFDTSTTWMRIAKLRVTQSRHVAAADALQRAIRAAGTSRHQIAEECMTLATRSKAPREMLPVYRLLSVQLPANDGVQMAFARSLEQNGRGNVAAEVYRRLLRRGLNDADTLDAVRRELERLAPGDQALAGQSLADLEAESAAAPENFRKQFRLAQAYFYSLRIDEAARTLEALAKRAPHYPGLNDLLPRVYRVQGDQAKLAAALREKLKTSKDADAKRQAAMELFGMLYAAGKTDAALATAKQLIDPADVSTIIPYGFLLQYLGRDDEAIALFEDALKRDKTLGLHTTGPAMSLIRLLVKRGKSDRAADEFLAAARRQGQQTVSSPFGRRMRYGSTDNPFDGCEPLFLFYPEFQRKVGEKVEAAYRKKTDDSAARNMLVNFYRSTGRTAAAEKLIDSAVARNAADDEAVTASIARAVKRKDYKSAIALAEKWLAAHPKPAVPAGVPAHIAAQLAGSSERTGMIGTIGDLHWQLGDRKKALEAYRRLIDKNVPATRILYATICLFRQQPDEAKRVIDQGLNGLKVKPASLLQFRAMLALLKGDHAAAFDDLLAAQQFEGNDNSGRGFAVPQFSGGSPGLLPMIAKGDRQLAGRYIAHLKSRIKKNPNDWTRYQSLVTFLKGDGRVKEIEAVLAQADRVAGVKQSVLEHRLLEAETRKETPAKMIPLYRELVALADKATTDESVRRFGGESTVVYYKNRLADLLWTAGKKDDAKKLWIGNGDQRSAATWNALAVRLIQRGDDAGAAEALQKAVKLDPRQITTRLLLAELAHRRNDTAAALKHLQTVIAHIDTSTFPSPELEQTGRYSNWPNSSEGESAGRQIVESLLQDESIVRELKQSQSDLAARTRLVLAASLGDWKTVEIEAARIRKTSPYDPQATNALKRASMRRGQWAAALTAKTRIDRFNAADLADRRSRLKVLLSGKRNRAASSSPAAPARAGAGGSPFGSMQMMHYRGMHRHGVLDGTPEGVPLLLRLNRTKQAEAEILKTAVSEGGALSPALVAFFRHTQRPKRALEIARLLALIQESGMGTSEPDQIFQLLVEAGRSDDAIALLVRQHELNGGTTDEMRTMYAYSRGFGSVGEADEGLQLSPAAAQIFSIAKRTGKLPQTRAGLRERFAKSPQNEALAILSADLDTLAGDLDNAIATLRTLRKSRPDDRQIPRRLFGLLLRKKAWAEAATLAKKPTANGKFDKSRWRRYAALAAILAGDKPAAVKALLPAKKPSSAARSESLALLIAADQTDRALKLLDAPGWDEVGLDADGRVSLKVRLLQRAGRMDQAVQASATAFWKSPRLQLDSEAWRQLAGLAARLRPNTTAPKLQRPEDGALWQLFVVGPAAGEKAFQSVLKSKSDSFDARRGLLLCAQLNRNPKLALKTAEELLAWLKPRRTERRLRKTSTPLRERIAKVRLAMSARQPPVLLVSQIAEGTISLNELSDLSGDMSSDESSSATYQPVYDAYAEVRRSLLLQAGRDREYEQATRDAPVEERRLGGFMGGMSRHRGRFGGGGSLLSEHLATLEQNNPQTGEASNDRLVRELYRYHRINWAGKLLAKPSKTQRGANLRVAAEFAALRGKLGEAKRLRHQYASKKIAALPAEDQPSPAPPAFLNEQRNSYGQDAGMAYVQSLGNTAPTRPRSNARRNGIQTWSYYGYARYYGDNSGDLIDAALRDPAVAKKLESLAGPFGPGWQETTAVELLLQYYEAKQQPRKVLELIDRVLETKLPPAGMLGSFIRAAYGAKDYGRIEKTFAALEQQYPQLKPRIALQRILLHRHRGEASKAAAIEKSLLAAIPPRKREPVSELAGLLGPVLPDHRHGGPFGGYSYQYRYLAQYDSSRDNSDLHSMLIRGFGLGFGEPESNGISLGDVRRQYAAHGFHKHALRILERELAEFPKGDNRRWPLLTEQGRLLHKSGNKAEARTVLTALRAELMAAAKKTPQAATEQRLARLHAMPEFGADFEAALSHLGRSRRLDGRSDRAGLTEGLYLFQLKRHAAAWKEFESAMQRGRFHLFQTNHLFAAGISAHRAGNKPKGLALLRQALWQNPDHKWAKDAREIVDGKEAD